MSEDRSIDTSAREFLGLPSERAFLTSSSPRPVDKDQIRALHEGKLPRDLELEVRDLTLAYREWAEASREVLLDLLGSRFQNTRVDESGEVQEDQHDVNRTIQSEGPAELSAIQKHTSTINGDAHFRTRRLFAMATAALFLLAGSIYWLLVPPNKSASVLLVDNGRHVVLDSDGRLSGLPNLDESLRTVIRDALSTGHVRVDAESPNLVGLRAGHPTRSNSSLIRPFYTVVLADRPIFEWRPPPDASDFVVRVYDESSRIIAESPPVSKPEWTAIERLDRGQTYTWNVTAQVRGDSFVSPPEGESRPIFRILDAEALAHIEALRGDAGGSHLALGILYVREGLFDDAEAEFKQLLDENSKSDIAKALLEAVRRLRE